MRCYVADRISSHPEVFYKKGILKNFTKFPRKHLYRLFLNKLQTWDNLCLGNLFRLVFCVIHVNIVMKALNQIMRYIVDSLCTYDSYPKTFESINISLPCRLSAIDENFFLRWWMNFRCFAMARNSNQTYL